MSEWKSIQECPKKSWTASDGKTYEICYDHKSYIDMFTGGKGKSGNAVPRKDDGSCIYPEDTARLRCNSSSANAPASNTTCPDRFSSKDGACYGTAYGVKVHGFSGYSKTRKAQWACNAGEGVTWEAVLPNKPLGKTWWIGDENGGYCTNNKVEILTKGKCGNYGQIIDMTSPEAQNKSWYECRSAKGFTKYNPYNFAPGDQDAMASQILANTGFETRRCWFSDDNWPHEKATYKGKSSDMHELNIKARCHFPENYKNFAYCRPQPVITQMGGPDTTFVSNETQFYHNKDGNRQWFNADMTLKLSDNWLAQKIDPTNNVYFVGRNRPFWDWQTQTGECYKHNTQCRKCSFKRNNNLGMHVSADLKLDKIHENCRHVEEHKVLIGEWDYICTQTKNKSKDEQNDDWSDYNQNRIRINISGITKW